MSLPSGYTRLEYIESTGTQYVDTGFRPNQDSRVICDYQLTSSASGQTPFMGRTKVSVDTLGIFYGDASTIAFDYGTNRETDTTISIMSRMLVDFDKNNVTYNGKQKTLPPATFQSTATLTIFARHTGVAFLSLLRGNCMFVKFMIMGQSSVILSHVKTHLAWLDYGTMLILRFIPMRVLVYLLLAQL